MPANLLKSRGCVLQASAAKTATGTSGAIKLPMGESYLFILDATTVTGTSPTMDVALQITHDDGTTFYSICRFAQVTAAAKLSMRLQPTLGRGEAASAITIADTGGSLINNIPLSRKIQFKWTIGGTNPSFTFAINLIVVPKQAGTY